MIVRDLDVVGRGPTLTVRARTSSETDPRETFELRYRVTGADGVAARAGDMLTAALLLPAMVVGEPLSISEATSARLVASVPEIQRVYTDFGAGLSSVELDAPTAPAPAGREGGALFFSGGVDSHYSRVQLGDRVDHLIFVLGVDVRDAEVQRRVQALEAARRVAEEHGASLIVVETNVQNVLTQFADWRLSHGAALASIALLLGAGFSRCYIAASNAYRVLEPWGSHPVLDHLWSTEWLEVAHHGIAHRWEKLVSLSESPSALESLRVCYRRVDEYNCGRCRKCLSTMAALHALDVLDKSAFPALDVGALTRIDTSSGETMLLLADVLSHLERHRPTDPTARAIRSVLRRRYRRVLPSPALVRARLRDRRRATAPGGSAMPVARLRTWEEAVRVW